MVLIAEKKLELPRYPAHTGPSSEYKQWFGRKSVHSYQEMHRERWPEWEFERNCVAALVVAGIGQRKCPVRRPWAYTCIAGAMIVALADTWPVIPEKGFGSEADIEEILWEALWEAVGKNREKLDADFLKVMMRNLLPRSSYTPPFSASGSESRFADKWHNPDTGFADSSAGRVCNLRQECIKEGKKALTRLPEPVQASVREVARHVPRMTRIVVTHISRAEHP